LTCIPIGTYFIVVSADQYALDQDKQIIYNITVVTGNQEGKCRYLSSLFLQKLAVFNVIMEENVSMELVCV
jgi:hypothetical protein